MGVNKIKIGYDTDFKSFDMKSWSNKQQEYNNLNKIKNTNTTDILDLERGPINVDIPDKYEELHIAKSEIEEIISGLEKDREKQKEVVDEQQKINRNNTWKHRANGLLSSDKKTEMDEGIKITESTKNSKQNEIDEIDATIAYFDSLLYQINNELKYEPYGKLAETIDYKNFAENYNYNYQNINYKILEECIGSPDIIGEYLDRIKQGKSEVELKAMYENGEFEIDKMAILEYFIDNSPENVSFDDIQKGLDAYLVEVFHDYKYMTEDQRMMYHYIFSTEGESGASKYMDAIEDSINQAEGAAKAAEFIDNLDLTDKGQLEKSLGNMFDVGGKGLSDGINTFFDGIANVIKNNDTLTADEYERMIILQYLQEKSNYFDEYYQFSSTLGNMIPAMAVSAVVSYFGTPAAGAKVASTLMGLSSGGNAKHQALVSGNDILISTIYGMFIGSSEATLGYFLGKIPGISETSGLTLKNLLSEGTEEYIQTWVEAGCKKVLLGEDINWDEVSMESAESFGMGMLMAGFLNGGQAITVTINGVAHNFDINKILEYKNANPNCSITEAMETVNSVKLGKNKTNSNVNTKLKSVKNFKSLSEAFLLIEQKFSKDKIRANPLLIFNPEFEHYYNEISKFLNTKDGTSAEWDKIREITFNKINAYNIIISNRTEISGEEFGKMVTDLDLSNRDHLNYIKEYMVQYENYIPAGLLDKINHAIMANSEVTSEINNNTDVNTKMNETNNTFDVEEVVFDDDYSNYSIEQIMNISGYKELSNILLSKAPSEDIRIKLESILYKGGYNGFSINSGICNKSNPKIEARKRISIAKLLLKNPETFDVLMKTNVNLFHGTNANALPNILKYGLNSYAEAQNLGIDVVTGEKWSRIENNQRNFVSFTDVLPVATGYSTLSPEKSASNLAFEVIIGTTTDDVYDSGKVTIRSDVVEVGAEKGIPLDGIKVIGVPSDKVSYVQKLLGDNTNIEIVAIDGINDGLYSNCDFDEWSTMDIDKLNEDLIAKPASKTFGIEEINNFVNETDININDVVQNENTLKTEILSLIPSSLDNISKMRMAYIELNKRVHYNDTYTLSSNNDYKNDIYTSEVSFNNLNDTNIICKGWSELYKELLIDLGFNPNDIKLCGGKNIGSHVWVEVNLNNGNILVADAAEAIINSDGYRSTDIANCKAGFSTVGFYVLPDSYSGKSITSIFNENLNNIPIFEQSSQRWIAMDRNIGYANSYYNKAVIKADQLFGNGNCTVADIDNVIENIKIPENMNGTEAFVYLRTLKNSVFDSDISNNMNLRLGSRKVSSGIEGVMILNYSEGNKVTIYSKELGQVTFDISGGDMNDFKSFMISNGMEKYIQ